ncbi:DUF1799 domain-containing protein [Stenotrophomonas sp.]|uniref:DUF1799 domain-containing protein n=1 Tax=Stenotrophomonas sp. TaxID=69392 RepID=UPI0028AF7547|nr:DUF1799 domain-containing protein [Stenotrophomonas sp.]
MYWRAPTEAELAGSGLKAKHFQPPEVDLWPECALPIEIYSRVATQWRVGAGGPIGLDYGVIFYEMDREGLEGEKRDEVMAGIRVIETAALAEFASSSQR